ncbi:MAG: DUF1636 domain-containing protein [Roseibium sp.]|nr:DUF1636 domain-containing protein [Roseibium sp.]
MLTRSRVCMSVCTRCRPPDFAGPDNERPGYQLAGSLLRRARDETTRPFTLTTRGVRCMSQCKRPCVIALSAPAKFTLVFGDLDPQADTDAVMALTRQYAESTDGLVLRADRPAPLRSGILGRIPPLGYAGEAIDESIVFDPHALNQEELS